jgi:Rieske Fe-S protein
VRQGGRIFTHTHASAIEGGKNGAHGRVTTADSGPVVHAANIVVATNTPVNDWLTLHTKQYPYRTYVIAAPVPQGSVTRALYWDTPRPYHYLRLHDDDGVEMLIAGGEDHKTGQEDDMIDPYGELERWTRERVPDLGPVRYRWSGQVMEPMDGVAFIGRNPGEDNVWIVTGDSGNGMTHGVIAGMLVGDQIVGRDNPWESLYDPSRKTLRAAGEFARENINMAAQYTDWITPGDVTDEREIPVGCGAVVRDGLKKLAVYRDERGALHRFSAVCPHLGAILRWNPQEGTWDCPAHGSRFAARGEVLNGPANDSLAEVGEGAHVMEQRSKR